jgi:hypothetical protein
VEVDPVVLAPVNLARTPRTGETCMNLGSMSEKQPSAGVSAPSIASWYAARHHLTGAQGKRDVEPIGTFLALPLGEQARAVLVSTPRAGGNGGHLFQGEEGGRNSEMQVRASPERAPEHLRPPRGMHDMWMHVPGIRLLEVRRDWWASLQGLSTHSAPPLRQTILTLTFEKAMPTCRRLTLGSPASHKLGTLAVRGIGPA